MNMAWTTQQVNVVNPQSWSPHRHVRRSTSSVARPESVSRGRPEPPAYVPEAPTADGQQARMVRQAVRVLELLPEQSADVAVVITNGTYCPVTIGHLACLNEARLMLLGEPSHRPAECCKAPRPAGLPVFKAVIGCVRVNADLFTVTKMNAKGCPEAFIPKATRMELIDLAARDADMPWLCAVEGHEQGVQLLAKLYPRHRFQEYFVDGADHAVEEKYWRVVCAQHRRMCAGRAATDGEQNGTDDVLRALEQDGRGINSAWFQEGFFAILPEQEETSSSAVRRALKAVPPDMAVLQRCLHPSILRWCLTEGPYRNADYASFFAGNAPMSIGGRICETTSQLKLREASPPPPPVEALGAFVVRRGYAPWVSFVYSEPYAYGQSHTGDGGDRASSATISDGTVVHLSRLDPSKRFGLVTSDRTEGWVHLRNLHCTEGKTRAVYDRKDVRLDTQLRAEPSEAKSFVKNRQGQTVHLDRGSEVLLMYPDRRGDAWFFLFVCMLDNGCHCGWVKSDHLRFQ